MKLLPIFFLILFISCSSGGGEKESCETYQDCSEGLICLKKECVDESVLCVNQNCSGHGNCIVENGEAVCICDSGYDVNGLSCIEEDKCKDISCSQKGFCSVNDLGEPECKCNQGYITSGLNCILNPCNGISCSNHGSCSVENSSPKCNCEQGYIENELECIFSLECIPNPEGEICGDGLDNNCDNVAEEGCSCNSGETIECYTGPIGLVGQGVCVKGSMSCIGGESWGDCVGEVLPTEEFCDSYDNDCDGTTDIGSDGTALKEICYSGNQEELLAPAGVCRSGIRVCNNGSFSGECVGEILPANQEICGNGIDDNCNGETDEECGPPIVTCSENIDHIFILENPARLSATAVDSNANGTVISTKWEFISKPSGTQIELNPTTTLSTSFIPDMVGEYIARFTATDNDGEQSYCEIRVYADTHDFLSVSLTWDKGGNSDMDLHLLRPDVDSTRWNRAPDDCFWGSTNPDWGDTGNTLDNPSLDLDDTNGWGPELIQIERPKDGRYTVGVLYFDDQGQGSSVATIKILCNGEEFVFTKTLSKSGKWSVKDIIWNGETCTVGDASRVF
ncbi:hypothetical protein JXR93_02830 [bacterium]|nr:hypothetical protein [bacterium]